MILESEFSWYDLVTKRKYLLDIFTWIKDVYPIYETIYTYLHETEFPNEIILDDLYKKIQVIGDDVHETEIEKHYHSIVDSIEKIKALETSQKEPNPDDLLADI